MPAETTTDASWGPGLETPDWKGTARYEVLRCIGKGGMGLVYEAFDRERQQRVALKTLLNSSPAALYLFKQEFRTLADVHHRNLVRLYELVVGEDGRVFFTMELVNGTDFLTYVQKVEEPGPPADAASGPQDEPTRREQWADCSEQRIKRARRVPDDGALKPSPSDIERLRLALGQLVEAVRALHAAGKLHRDIKPSNVRVTPEGRVVVLDFGVATELSRVVDENLQEGGEMVGTARYMAPEQALNEGPTAACDWYSVGVMLYEALVGSPPFVGSAFDVLKMKSMLDPPPPGECVEGVPDDLDQLASALLLRAPELRPSGPEILHRLGMRQSLRPVPTPAPVIDVATTIVGREAPLRALRDAFEVVRTGRSITVLVGGPSGMGKSTIVQHFLDELVERGEAVVLRGRAYERESVPYKGVDSVVDALSRYLMRLSDREDSLTLPHDVWALARLFPVLRRVPSIASMEEPVAGDPTRMRRRAFFALRELLAALTRRQPLVVFVDGVQWGDSDSAALLLELVRPPDAPPLLLVMTFRDEELQTSPFLIETRGRWPALAEMRNIAIGPLQEDDTRRLALTLLGTDDGRSRITADAIALEARGSPFLVDELARSVTGPHRVARSEDTSPGIATVTLEQMVKARLARLPERELRLLRIVAIAGRPLPVSVAADAAGIRDTVDDAIGLIRARRFVRTGIRGGIETVEMIHDRIREMIVAKLSPRIVREHHRELAGVLEASPDADPEAIATHLIGAGERERAAVHAERAAEKAASQLAFDRAVSLYRLTLDTLGPASPASSRSTPASSRSTQDVHRLRLRLAELLEWAGRGAESAKVYLEEAQRAPAPARVNLERAAAEQLLTSGRIDEGAEVLHRVLDSLGMKAPRSAASALFWLVVYRLVLLVVGLRFTDRDPKDVRPEDRVRIDALYSVALGFVLVDVILGACMQARHLLYALRAGDSFQVMRAVGLEATNLASAGGRESRRERKLRATRPAARPAQRGQGRADVHRRDARDCPLSPRTLQGGARSARDGVRGEHHAEALRMAVERVPLRRRHAHGAGRPARGRLAARATAPRCRRARRPLHDRQPAHAGDGLPVAGRRRSRPRAPPPARGHGAVVPDRLSAPALAGDALRGGDRALRGRCGARLRSHRARRGRVPPEPPRPGAGAARSHVVPARPLRDCVARRRALGARRPPGRGAQTGAAARAREDALGLPRRIDPDGERGERDRRSTGRDRGAARGPGRRHRRRDDAARRCGALSARLVARRRGGQDHGRAGRRRDGFEGRALRCANGRSPRAGTMGRKLS